MKFNINFLAWRKLSLVFSIIFTLVSIISLTVKELNYGLDFTGGTLIELSYPVAVEISSIRSTLEEANYQGAQVANFGSNEEILIKLPLIKSPEDTAEGALEDNDKIGTEIVKLLKDNSENLEIDLRRIEYVGPQIGDELRDQGGKAMLLALFFMMIYIAFRFQSRFAGAAVIALIHDVIIVLGIFSFSQLDFDLTVLAALLAVIGYSLNDTIVVSDRIRENLKASPEEDTESVINRSLNQTLGRTLITSITTLLVLLSLYFLGGEALKNFALALIFGVIVGTYSSIYIASNALIIMGLTGDHLKEIEPENEDINPLP
jgi:preprotein translocase subunit SecF